jgi:hypothetical protein
MRDAFHSPTKLTPVTVLADFAPSVHQRGVGASEQLLRAGAYWVLLIQAFVLCQYAP